MRAITSLLVAGLIATAVGFLGYTGGLTEASTARSDPRQSSPVKSDSGPLVLESTVRRGMAYKTSRDTTGPTINPTIRVTKGDTVSLLFRNTAGGMHDLVIPAFGVDSGRLYGRETTRMSFVAHKAGTYPYFCSVSGHRRAGMEGTLIVEHSDRTPRRGGNEP